MLRPCLAFPNLVHMRVFVLEIETIFSVIVSRMHFTFATHETSFINWKSIFRQLRVIIGPWESTRCCTKCAFDDEGGGLSRKSRADGKRNSSFGSDTRTGNDAEKYIFGTATVTEVREEFLECIVSVS